MNKIKKIAIGALLAVSAGCLGVAAAGCNEESAPDYFKLTFEGKGLDYVLQGELAPEDGEQFVSGYLVRAGVEVRFTLAPAEDTEGVPVVLLNGKEITPGDDGVYSFVISKESVVSVSGLKEKKTVTFSSGDYYKFIGEDGNEVKSVSAVKGEKVKFKVWVSPYMVPDFNITNNSEELEPDAQGYYTIDVAENSTVNISTLNQADSFLERGEGTGTADDPFIIRAPIDMFMVAALVNSDFYTTYSTAYYKLEDDIDMNGEKLFVIGDMSNANAIFCGNFDGNGHKISNFYLTDEVVDQESFDSEYLPYVGVFGAAVATTGGPVVIKNLTLENYTVNVHPALADSTEQQYFAGSLVAYGIGAQIDGCHAINGTITVQNDDKKTANVGGLVGVLQSAYDNTRSQLLTYDAYVNGCSTKDVQVGGSGILYCVGGAVGMLATADTQAIAYVSNTVTTGSVSGTIFVGGVVGNLSRFSSVANCYSSSAVTAKNTNNTVGMVELIKSANAGGIVGYAENDTVISGCYSANTAISASSASNNRFASKDGICARKEVALSQASDSAEAVAHNNLVKGSGEISQLGWSTDEWDLTGNIPVFKGNATRTIDITGNCNGANVFGFDLDISAPAPIYTRYGNGISEYFTSSSGRSWGYYFDAELTQKVPNGYIPLTDVVLYFGLADYSEVEGQYYLGATTYGINAYITLDNEGGYLFRDGGLTYTGTYSYDGEKVTLYYSCLGAMEFTADETNGSYVTMVMEKDGDGYKLGGKLYVRKSSGSAGDYTSSLEELSLTATKKSNTFAYGEYTNSNDATLVLKENGTGSYIVGKNSIAFTFTITADGIVNSEGLSITLTGNKVTSFMGYAASLKDGFAGSWKMSAGSAIEYTFDGFGTVKCGGVTGTYEGDESGITITLGDKVSQAVLLSDSLIIDGNMYFLSDGFTGVWTGSSSANKEKVELALGGIGKNGYGEAEITFYAGVTSTVTGEYTVTEDGVMVLYVGDTLYGELKYNKVKGVAEGLFFSYGTYSSRNEITYVSTEFTLYDLFRGVWECNVDGVKQINFTGKTAGGSATAIVTYTNGKTAAATYSLDTATAGQIAIDGKTYNINLDEMAQRIAVTLDQTDAGSLAQKDDWNGVTLYDGDTAYTFDGRGYLGGKVTVSGGSSLAYVINADGMPEIEGVALVAGETSFTWGDKTLKFRTGFANTWDMSGDNSKITISEVSADFTAKLVVEGKEYTFDYNPERNTLTYSVADRKGVMTNVTISLQGGKELSVTVTGASNINVNFIAADALDLWKGTFTAQDGSYWTFDGHGLAEYGSGKATYVDKKGKKTTYSYRQDSLGLVQILTGTGKGMVFTEVEEGGYSKDGIKSYSPVTADTLYLTEVRLNGEFYTFDGAGNLLNSSNVRTEYTYTYLTTYSSVPYVVVKDGAGKKLGTITKEGSINVLTLNDYKEWTLNGTTKSYIFVGGKTGGLWLVDGDKYVREYYYESSDYETVFYLTDMDEKDYKMTLKKTDNTFVLEELKDEN